MASYRVLVVTNLWPSEADPGYGSFVKAQMESLRSLGVDYEVVAIDGRASRWNYARAVAQMRRRLRAKSFDLLHAHFGLSGWVARCQFRVPVVVSFMGDDVLGQFKRSGRVSFYGRLLRISSFALARLVSGVIVKSRAMKIRLKLDSAGIIPNGVDLNLFHPMDKAEARRKLGLAPDKKYVLFPFDPAIEVKRYDLVEAALARAQVPELEILQVSSVPQAVMPLYMNAADVLVLASLSEGSPNAVKEALATNLPVITVEVGEAAELVGQTEGCFVVPRTAEAIAEKLVEVCRRGARARGRERVAPLAIENVARQIVEIYASIVHG